MVPIPDDILRTALSKVTGEKPVLASDVDWDLKTPCNDCPFLRTSPYHAGVAKSLQGYMHAIEANRFAHTCHKTDTRPSVDGPRNWQGRPKECVGSTMMLLKTGNGMDLQLPLLEALQADKFDCAEMTARAKADTRVFTVPQLLAFYARALKRRLEGAKRRARRKLKNGRR